LGRRRKPQGFELSPTIKSAKDVYHHMISLFKDKDHEEFYILILSRANKVKSIELISKGGISGTLADGKVIFKKALEQSASAIILCHNHPSGNLKPSKADIDLTNRLIEFGKLIDLQVLDHLIITNEDYFSFADNVMM
jgi:DNA repair protein RadC